MEVIVVRPLTLISLIMACTRHQIYHDHSIQRPFRISGFCQIATVVRMIVMVSEFGRNHFVFRPKRSTLTIDDYENLVNETEEFMRVCTKPESISSTETDIDKCSTSKPKSPTNTDLFSERKFVGPIQRPITSALSSKREEKKPNIPDQHHELDSNQFILFDLFKRNQSYFDEEDRGVLSDPFQLWTSHTKQLIQANDEYMTQQDDEIFYDSTANENGNLTKWPLSWTSDELKHLMTSNNMEDGMNGGASFSINTRRNNSMPWNSVLLDDDESLFNDKNNVSIADAITRSNLEMLWNDDGLDPTSSDTKLDSNR
jgi:hypothetical protein